MSEPAAPEDRFERTTRASRARGGVPSVCGVPSVRGLLSVVLGLACAARPAAEVNAPTPPGSAAQPAVVVAAPAWPARSEALLAQADDRLVLRGFGASGLSPFQYVIASDVHELLYDAELELVWFSDMGARLWVVDLRALAAAPPSAALQSAPASSDAKVLIASDLPEHQKLSVWVGDRYVEGPGQLGEGSIELGLRWEKDPSFETDAGEGLGQLEGRAWLERELGRSSRAVPAWEQPDEQGPHVELPASIAQCDNAELCGAARAFGPSGWQLVITSSDETHGDFAHYGCLLFDPARRAFTRPRDSHAWTPASAAELDTCGPYRFNAAGDAFLATDHVCRIGADCVPLDGHAIGWLEPGATVGRE